MWVLGKYLALQLPGWALLAAALLMLRDWGALSAWTGVGIWSLWVVKDLALYPFLRHAYGNAPSRYVGPDPLLGARAIAEDDLAPEGTVRVRGELWRAELADLDAAPVARGQAVRVRAFRGLTLRVEAEA